MQNIFYAALILVAVILIYTASTWNVNTYEDYLYGFWVADGDEFCEESDIDSMLLFIGDRECGWFSNTRTCYIIIMNDLCNQGFTLTYKTGWAGIGVGVYRTRAHVEFDEDAIWPEDVLVDVDMRAGTLRVHADGTEYARLHKQHETSNVAKLLEGAELVDA